MPTTVLGLFVVGRLARRHGLTVTLRPTPNGGTTATLAIPKAMYGTGSAVVPVPALSRAPASFARRPAIAPPVTVPPIPSVAGTFSWFAPEPLAEPAPPEPQPVPPSAPIRM